MRSRTARGWGRAVGAVAAVGVVTAGACTETMPTGTDDSQLPGEPVTVSLQLAWDEFASNLQVFGGFGRVDDMESTVVARAYDGLESRTLVRFGAIPRSAQVRDSTGTLRTDSALAFIDAYVVVLVDSAASTNTGAVRLAFGQTQEMWDTRTANWTNAVDTIGGPVPWSSPGGGMVTPLATWDFDPSAGDSAQFFFDSATIAQWREGGDSVRAGRIDLLTDGHRLKLVGAALRVIATSPLDQDTVIIFDVPATQATFIYDPPATAPVDGLRVGGSPAWRTVLDVALPTTLDGPPALCDAVGCPFALGPQHVTYAGLELRTRSSPTAFQPTDTVSMEVRPVLDKTTLPKAPLGTPLGGTAQGTAVPPEAFGVEGSTVDLPITRYVQSFLAGPDASGRAPPTTLAILPAPEPSTFSFASFYGPGGANAPVLNLVLTVSPPMEVR
jgi:hypothetical protein